MLAPTQIFRDGRIHASVGTTGGYGILQTTPQIIYNLLSNSLDVQRAIDAPRFSTRDDSTVILENSFSKQFKNSLSNKGYSIDNDFDDPMGDSSCVACGECVQACPTGALMPATVVDAQGKGDTRVDKKVESVCPYCGVGCQISYNVKDNTLKFV